MFDKNPYQLLKLSASYGRKFRNKVFVIKLSGDTITDPKLRLMLCEQIALLWSFSIRIVIVHGGGNELDDACARLGVSSQKIAGRRITTAEVLEVAKDIFLGKIHQQLLLDLESFGLRGVGMSGVNQGVIRSRKRPPIEVTADGDTVPKLIDFGLVGDIEFVDSNSILQLFDQDLLPVIAPLTSDVNGVILNTNADTIAAEVAIALGAEKIFFMLSVPGLLRNLADPSSLVTQIQLTDMDALEQSGIISGGMRPKMTAVKNALTHGVKAAHLVSGITADALLTEVFTNEGSGTMILGSPDKVAL